MTSVRYVRLTKEEYDDPDGTRRIRKLQLRLAGESRNIRRIYLKNPTPTWRGWMADIN